MRWIAALVTGSILGLALTTYFDHARAAPFRTEPREATKCEGDSIAGGCTARLGAPAITRAT